MPEKPTQKAAAATTTEQIWTPDKPEQPSTAWRARSRLCCLRQGDQEGSACAAASEEDELEAVEREVGVFAPSIRSLVKRRAKLPGSYDMHCEFFNCFESSTRLLRMKGSKATFHNICASIQHLSERYPNSQMKIA
ncbi:hypothetical protein ABZP36_035881 [Zizania latifolia]